MLTKVGTQILEELNNELNTDVEDKKKQFMIDETGSTINLLWRFFAKYIYMLHFCLSLLIIMTLVFIDSERIDLLMSTPLQDIMQLRDSAFFLAIYSSTFAIAITLFIYMANDYRSAKAKYIAENKAVMEQTKRQVELIEEIMHRHQLITKKEL